MKKKYIVLSMIFLLICGTIGAQETTEDTTAKTEVQNKKQSKKAKKEARRAARKQRKSKKPATVSQTKPVIVAPVVTKPVETSPVEVRPIVSKTPNELNSKNPQEIQTPSTGQVVTITPPDISFMEPYMGEVVEQKPQGNINWSQQYVEAKGQSVIDTERFKNKAQARAMATRGAVVVAQRNLLEMVQGVSVVGETTVEDMITTSDYIYTRVEGFVKGAEQVGSAREVDGLIEVTLRMPIYGTKGIAGAFENSDLVKAKFNNGYKFLTTDDVSFSEVDQGTLIDGSKPFVFNIMGEQIDPSMFPVVIDDNGNVQFDFSELYETKTGKFPKFVQLTKEVMNEVGYQKGVDIIDLIQTGKGELKLPKDSKKRVFWQKVGNVAKVMGKLLFDIVL